MSILFQAVEKENSEKRRGGEDARHNDVLVDRADVMHNREH